MAQKDTIAALVKRGIADEVATTVVKQYGYGSLGDISSAGVDGLVEKGLDEAVAKAKKGEQ